MKIFNCEWVGGGGGNSYFAFLVVGRRYERVKK